MKVIGLALLVSLFPGALGQGIEENKPNAEILAEGWMECYSGRYDTPEDHMFGENVKAACGKSDQVMLGCRPTGQSDWQLVGWGNSDKAFMDTGINRDQVTLDGDIQWYFNDDYSMGFSPAGEGVSKSQCDTYMRDSSVRLCWHTLNNYQRGWRCGTATGNSLDFERKAWYKMDPGMMDDPHMKSWRGEWFDYMGECDLVLAHAPKFDGELDMDIHVRTTIRYDYSFIEAAALRIGEDILEVGSWGDYALNGVEGAMDDADMVPTVGGYPVYYKQVNKKKHQFDIAIDQTQNITISTFKDWVSVKIINGNKKNFANIAGLMGTFDGKMLSRNGTNLHDDINALGQDWQVRSKEGNLFRAVRTPQHPQKCRLPSEQDSKVQRRLGASIQKEAAEKACAHLRGNVFSFCVHDVMASGDLDMAQTGAI